MLLPLYRLIPWDSGIHKTLYWLIVHLEIPLIRFILLSAGAKEVKLRNSILTPRYFHVLMSDIDISVAFDGEAKFLYDVSKMMKRFLPNLGEIEIYHLNEWDELETLSRSPAEDFWLRLIQLRKFQWIRKANAQTRTEYHQVKASRAMSILLEKLSHSEPPFRGDALFPEVLGASSTYTISLPIQSQFLEHDIGCDTQGVNFTTPKDAAQFASVLPDSRERPSGKLVQLKWYIMRRERLLSIVSLRTQSLNDPTKNLKELEHWIEELDRRSRSLEQKSF